MSQTILVGGSKGFNRHFATGLPHVVDVGQKAAVGSRRRPSVTISTRKIHALGRTEPLSGHDHKATLVHLDGGEQIEQDVDAIHATQEETAEESSGLDEDEGMIAKALPILDTGKPKASEQAVAVPRADTRKWWGDMISRDTENFDEDEGQKRSVLAILSNIDNRTKYRF